MNVRRITQAPNAYHRQFVDSRSCAVWNASALTLWCHMRHKLVVIVTLGWKPASVISFPFLMALLRHLHMSSCIPVAPRNFGGLQAVCLLLWCVRALFFFLMCFLVYKSIRRFLLQMLQLGDCKSVTRTCPFSNDCCPDYQSVCGRYFSSPSSSPLVLSGWSSFHLNMRVEQ